MCPCLFVVIFIIILTALALLCVSPLDAAGSSTTEGRLEAEVNVLLGVEPHDEAGYVDHLLPNSNVTLSDEDTSMVDRLGKSKLEHLGLKTTLQEILNLETEHVIELHATSSSTPIRTRRRRSALPSNN